MKKVFEAELSVEFIEPLNNSLKKEYAFASADGISGDVIISKVDQESDKSYRLNIAVLTERKRQFPSFEAYLELIKTVLGGQNKISVMSLKDIRTKLVRDGIKDSNFIEQKGNYKIVQDEDTDYLVVRIDNEMILDYHQTLKEAQSSLSNWSK